MNQDTTVERDEDATDEEKAEKRYEIEELVKRGNVLDEELEQKEEELEALEETEEKKEEIAEQV